MRLVQKTGVSLTLFASFALAAASTATNGSPFSPQKIKDFVSQKCGTTGSAVWVYEGALYDPLDGHKIANVEGLELVRQLADSSDSPQQRTNKLQASKIKGDFSATLLSRKLFCYQSPNEPRRLLDSIRLRPNAPRRTIPTNQAVALYDSATTFVSRNSGQDLILHTEWPNGKCAWGSATSSSQQTPREANKNNNSSMDFSVFCKPSSMKVPDVTDSSQQQQDAVTVAPRRSQWIQFGASSQQQPNESKFGARETYSYTLNELPVSGTNWLDRFFRRKTQDASLLKQTVKYTRYGEGPPWYGPGKYCMLELTGRKVASVEEAPPLAATVAAQYVPGFLSVDTPISSDVSATRAVEWFQRGNLQLLEEDGVQGCDGSAEQAIPKGGIQKLAYNVKKQGGRAFSRIRAASTIESNVNTN